MNVNKQPYGSDPLRAEIARRLALVMKARKIDMEKVAQQTGLTEAHINALTLGRGNLDQEVCRRLLNWFRGQKTPASPKFAGGKDAWKTYAVEFPPDEAERVSRVSMALYMNVPDVIFMAVLRFMNDEPGLLVTERIANDIRKSQMSQMLHSIPDLKEILTADLDLAIEMGKTIDQVKPAEEVKTLPSQELKKELDRLNKPTEDSELEVA
jgi:transcriptional regulator with XRE-family HTH domain